MALIIETGSNVPGAQSYVTAAEFTAFHLAYYAAFSAGTEPEKEAALRRAVAYLDGLRWSGLKSHGRDQALSWPRAGATDKEGWGIDSDVVPVEVKEAQMILARAEIAEPGALLPTFTATKQKTLVQVDNIHWQAPSISATSSANKAIVTDALSRLTGFIAPVGMAHLARS